MQGDSIHSEPFAVALVAPLDPRLHFGMFVSRVIVDDQMEAEAFGRLRVELLEEAEPFHVRVFRCDVMRYFPIKVVQRRKQSGGAVPDVIVGCGFDMSDTEGEPRLGAFQRLALALLVAAEDQGAVGRLKVEADDVPEFFLEVLVVG